MPRLILKCDIEIENIELHAGDEIEVDEDNAKRLIRRNAAVLKKSAPKKKKAKAEADE
tara:strand:+ start:263 stop:436 length:174 start_codon:yes stop_codon:yes gene_type:complete